MFLLLGNVGVWAQDESDVTTVATFSSADLVTKSTYASTYGGDDWFISMGGNNVSIGFNDSNCTTIGDALETAAKASDYGVVVKSKKALASVNRITFVYTGGKNDGGKIYLASSNDNVTWKPLALKTGEGLSEQGTTVSRNTTLTFEFDANDNAYYGIILDKGNSSKGTYRFDNVVITFYNVSTGPSITALDVTYAADKLKGEIPYTINNGEADAEITASSTTSWIHNVDVDAANNKVTFDMSKNTETTPRYGVVTIKYTKGETVVPQNVTVTQEGFKEKYTVTFADDGSSLSEETGGAGITLPTRTDVAPYTFKGWTTVDLLVETTEEPTIYSGKYNPESNITLYPVYVRIEDSGLKNVNVSTTIADYAATNGWSDGVKYTSLVLDDNISISAIGSSNTGKYYKTDNSWRFYSSETAKLKVTASEGATLTTVTLTFTGKSSSEPATVKYNGTEIKTDESVSVSGSTVEFDVTGGQARVSAIAVVYTTGSSTSYYTSHPVAPTTATITLSEACKDADSFYYGTYSNSKPFVVSEDIIVAEISVIDGKLLIDEYNPGDIVPANTGVMVSSDVAGDHTVNLSKEAGTSILGENNMLRPTGDTGITADEMAAADANCKYYRLTMHKGTTLGFFWGAADGAAFNVAANKAYLAVPQEIAQKIQSFVIGDGGTTSIDGITTDGSENAQRTVYNLQGQRVNPDAAHGLYIVNGKKVIIR